MFGYATISNKDLLTLFMPKKMFFLNIWHGPKLPPKFGGVGGKGFMKLKERNTRT
jgi:hypothetical protein